MASSNENARSNPAGNELSESDKATSGPNPAREVTSEKAAEIARNLQQVFTKIGQQPIPPRLQEIIDRMAEEERRNE
jgi:hypothetical protein